MAAPPWFKNVMPRYLHAFTGCEIVGYKAIDVTDCPHLTRPRLQFKVKLFERTQVIMKLWIGEKDEENPLRIWVDNDPVLSSDFFTDWFILKKNHPVRIESIEARDFVFLPKRESGGQDMLRANFRLELAWDDKTVVIGNFDTDIVVGTFTQALLKA
ncbi:hypothetical protein R1flu_000307 [Riccia fluitans]|uniref:Uncharacterized protein n=1 Tax=Riccia fluitans TaxID=41844 RepID=A0ABD1Y390_9MARC